jgi:Lrp/AsnC family transcriptional regulator, leucine-responsive regulatory protein
MELDDLDFKILGYLQEDGRMAHTAIARLVELSSPAVTSRVQRLEKAGLIRGYTALLNPEPIGQGLLAFIRVRTGSSVDDSLAFEQYTCRAPEVLECHDVDGEDSYILKVRAASPQALRELIARIRSFPDVTRTITSIVLLTLREEPLTAPLRLRGGSSQSFEPSADADFSTVGFKEADHAD